jgi:Uma2 family endonuclease
MLQGAVRPTPATDHQSNAHLSSMSTELQMPSHRMTVAEFLEWDSGNRTGALWQLRDGEPEMMPPASDSHGSIHSALAYLLTARLDAHGSPCRVVTTPGVVPAQRSEENCLVPDLGITCAPLAGARLLHEPVVLIEIPSPTNVSKTRANLLAYRTIPSLAEIVVLRSTSLAAEILRRGPDGARPAQPDLVDANGGLRLDSIGFAAPLRAAYRTTDLA